MDLGIVYPQPLYFFTCIGMHSVLHSCTPAHGEHAEHTFLRCTTILNCQGAGKWGGSHTRQPRTPRFVYMPYYTPFPDILQLSMLTNVFTFMTVLFVHSIQAVCVICTKTVYIFVQHFEYTNCFWFTNLIILFYDRFLTFIVKRFTACICEFVYNFNLYYSVISW